MPSLEVDAITRMPTTATAISFLSISFVAADSDDGRASMAAITIRDDRHLILLANTRKIYHFIFTFLLLYNTSWVNNTFYDNDGDMTRALISPHDGYRPSMIIVPWKIWFTELYYNTQWLLMPLATSGVYYRGDTANFCLSHWKWETRHSWSQMPYVGKCARAYFHLSDAAAAWMDEDSCYVRGRLMNDGSYNSILHWRASLYLYTMKDEAFTFAL